MGLWSGLQKLWHWLRHGFGLTAEELARRLGCGLAELEALQPAYREFQVPKRSGGQRRLCAPEDRLKEMQRRILRRLLARLKCHPAATGFQPGQSIVTHARRHASRAVIVRLDIKDFFPTTAARRVYKYFRRIGWNRTAGRLLARLCTHEGGLPQGAPTSPRLSNLVNYRLDCRLAAMARKLGAGYSRYADDITLSFPVDDRKRIRYMITFAGNVARSDGYQVHGARKLQIRRQHQQQRVTGLVVNERVGLPRTVRRRLRAIEHHVRTGRPATLSAAQLAGWRALQHMIAVQAVDASQQDEMKKEHERLQGAWLIVPSPEETRAGPETPAPPAAAPMKWLIEGDRVLLEHGEIQVEALIRLDARGTPRTIDLVPTSGTEKGRRIRGIYAWQEQRLQLCLARGRPTSKLPAAAAGCR